MIITPTVAKRLGIQPGRIDNSHAIRLVRIKFPGAVIVQRDTIEVVGPKLWAKLHKAALDPSLSFVNFIKVVQGILMSLPCGECKNDSRTYLSLHPVPQEFPDRFAWTVDWHNHVNLRIGKRFVPSMDAFDFWSNK